MSVIKTYSGLYFDLNNLDSNIIQIKDIAHSLSLICRGNGHVKNFYSVAQHSIACCKEAILRNYSNRIILGALLHDASECYFSDVPSPIKQQLVEYKKLEQSLMDIIYIKFLGSNLTEEETSKIHIIDKHMLKYDLKYLLNEEVGNLPHLKFIPSYNFVDFLIVENEFLELFEKYKLI